MIAQDVSTNGLSDVCVLIPTRGVVFSAVMQSVCLQGIPSWNIFLTSGEPTPSAFNHLVEMALQTDCQYFLFVEEDTVPPFNCAISMKKLLDSHPSLGSVAVEYPVFGGHSTVVRYEKSGLIIYTGLGCTMVRRAVFEALEKPWFEANQQLVIEPEWQRGWRSCDPEKQYGLYDILFFTKMRASGWTIAQLSGVCDHLHIIKDAKTQQNGSTITIGQKSDQCTPSTLPIDPLDYWHETNPKNPDPQRNRS